MTVDSKGTYKFSIDELKKYQADLMQKVATETDEEKKGKYNNQIGLINIILNNPANGNKLADAYGNAVGLQNAPSGLTGEQLYQKYLDAHQVTANILDANKNLKVADQKKLDDYLVKKMVGE